VKKPSRKKTAATIKQATSKYLNETIDIPSFVGTTSETAIKKNESILQKNVDISKESIINQMFEDTSITSISTAKANWYFGEWQALVDLDIQALGSHPDVDKFTALKAAGYQQLGDIEQSKAYFKLAKKLGCDNAIITTLLLAGMHNSLGKISALRDDTKKMHQHFDVAVALNKMGPNNKLAKQSRIIKELTQLGLINAAENILDVKVNDLTKAKYLNKQQLAELQLIKKEQIALRSSVGNNALVNKNKKSKLVLVASMPRSGSTWLFNCVKELIAHSNKSLYSCWIGDYDDKNSAEIHLVKVHDPTPELSEKADLILSTRRDIREVAASLVRMEWDQKGDEFFAQLSWVINTVHPYWFERTDFEIEYNRILLTPALVVEEVGHSLKVVINPKKSAVIANKLANLQSPQEYDKNTQLHPNHRAEVAQKYTEILSKKTINEINNIYGSWLDCYNY
jgi:hypothetical protein